MQVYLQAVFISCVVQMRQFCARSVALLAELHKVIQWMVAEMLSSAELLQIGLLNSLATTCLRFAKIIQVANHKQKS